MTASPHTHIARVIALGAQVPRRSGVLGYWLGLMVLRAMGWRVTGDFPNIPRAVLALAPHTSNQDGVIGVASILALRIRISFFVKDAAFRWPLGVLLRWLGGVPIDREQSHDVVGLSARKLREAVPTMIALAPEGTRDASPQWKTGFYWMAHQAQVPIILVGLDYARREVRILQTFTPSGDVSADLPLIINAYRGVTPKHAERLSAPLRELH